MDTPGGTYSVAVQFVETATGRASGFQALGQALTLRAEEGGLSGEAERPAQKAA